MLTLAPNGRAVEACLFDHASISVAAGWVLPDNGGAVNYFDAALTVNIAYSTGDMFFELRQYRIFPGKRDEWVKFMEERIMPGQLAHGVVIVGSFVGQQEEDLYVWIRRFDSEEHRATFTDAYYGSDEWKNELLPRVKEMLDFPSMVITRLEATPKSVIR